MAEDNTIENKEEETPSNKKIVALTDLSIWVRREVIDKANSNYAKYLYGPDMSLTILGAFIVLIVAAFCANFSYTKLQKDYQTQLMEVAEQTDILASACSQIPSIDAKTCKFHNSGTARSGLSDTLIWSILIEADIIDRTDVETPANLLEVVSSEIALWRVYDMLKSVDREKETGLGFLVGLSRGMCSNTSGMERDVAYQKAIAYFVAGLFPTTMIDASQLNDIRDLIDDSNSGDIKLSSSWTDKIWRTEAGFPLNIRRFQTPRDVTDAEIAGQMLLNSYASDGKGYRYTEAQLVERLNGGENPFKCRLEGMSPAERWQGFENFEKLLTWGLGQVRTTTQYRAVAYRLTLFTGPEQFFIFFVGFFALVLSLSRLITAANMIAVSRKTSGRFFFFFKTNSENTEEAEPENNILRLLKKAGQHAKSHSPSARGFWKDQLMDQVISARWPMRLAITILPAIGFIGTVRGIMKSLTGADGIVWANTASERAQAISELSADLGLAFATTMLALVFGVFLSIISAIEIRLFESAILPLYGANAFPDEESNKTDASSLSDAEDQPQQDPIKEKV